MCFADLNEAVSYAVSKDTYVTLESNAVFTPDTKTHVVIYTNGFNFTVCEYSPPILVTASPYLLSEDLAAYYISVPLFEVRHEDGTANHYYSLSDFNSLSNDYKDNALSFKNNDTVILYGDITTDVTFEIENYLGTSEKSKINLDINGHTFTSVAESAFTAGNKSNNRYSVYMNLSISSSIESVSVFCKIPKTPPSSFRILMQASISSIL